jgi:hypothetical protein
MPSKTSTPNLQPPKDLLSKLVVRICDQLGDLVDQVLERHSRRKPPQVALLANEDTAEYAASEK